MTATATPTLVVVSGPPGSGLTTLASAIAEAIPCPAVSRDAIKEGMVHAHGAEFETARGDPLTRRTFPLFFDVLRVLLAGGASVVAEASFQDRLWRQGLAPLTDLAHLRIVRCNVDSRVGLERLALRPPARRGVSRHRIDERELQEYGRLVASFEHVSLPVPTLDVRTNDGYDPPFSDIVEFVARGPANGPTARR